jgi:hypothetical protein
VAVVFQAVSDETTTTDGLGAFFTGGFIAPVDDWVNFFTPAWDEYVLAGPPRINHFHMVDLRSKKWRERNGIDRIDAERRISEAARIIGQSGSLFFVTSKIDAGFFKRRFATKKLLLRARTEQPAIIPFQPDFIGYLGFAYVALSYVNLKYPDADRVDFVVEQKQQVTAGQRELHDTLASSLEALGRPELAKLVGGFIPGSKERVPLQAADMGCWHVLKQEHGGLLSSEVKNYRPIASRFGYAHTWSNEHLERLARSAYRNRVANPFKKKRKKRRG